MGCSKRRDVAVVRDLLEQQKRGGPLFYVSRDGHQVGQESGWKNIKEKTITFRSGVDVRSGDWLSTLEGEKLYVTDTEIVNDLNPSTSRSIALEAHYMTSREYEREEAASQPQTPSITFGDFHGNPNVNTGQVSGGMYTGGSHTFDFRSIEQEIVDRGESPELLAAIQEIRKRLENGQPLEKGMLARVAERMQSNSWLTSHIGQALINFLTNT
jgi:hypothetical protein